jgi:kinesin family protein 2/24
MLAKDQTRLRIEKMEAERQQRRIRTKELRVTRAEEERRNLSQGNPGDVDFIGLVRQWREEHGGLACLHDDSNTISVVGGGGTASSMMIAASSAVTSTSSDDKICVCVRKRSLNAKELAKLEHDAVTCLHPTATVHSAKVRVDGISKYCDHHTFKFDHAFDELSTTEDVYRYTAKPLVQYVCDGGSSSIKGVVVPRATVFAYGQTGSGETNASNISLFDIYNTQISDSQNHLNLVCSADTPNERLPIKQSNRQNVHHDGHSKNGSRGYIFVFAQSQS